MISIGPEGITIDSLFFQVSSSFVLLKIYSAIFSMFGRHVPQYMLIDMKNVPSEKKKNLYTLPLQNIWKNRKKGMKTQDYYDRSISIRHRSICMQEQDKSSDVE